MWSTIILVFIKIEKKRAINVDTNENCLKPYKTVLKAISTILVPIHSNRIYVC